MSKLFFPIALLSGLFLGISGHNSTYSWQEGKRLEQSTALGGNIRAVALDGVDALVAEDEMLARVPLLGERAFQVVERVGLNQGMIVDLAHSDVALYALTDSTLVVLSPDGRNVRQLLEGGGEQLSLWENQLAVASRQAGVDLYQIMPDGLLELSQEIATTSETRQAIFVHASLLAFAERASGLRVLDLGSSLSSSVDLIPAHEITNFSHWVYVNAGNRLHSVDVLNPVEPQVVGQYAPIRDVQEIAIYGDFVLVADAVDGLKVYQRGTQYHYLSGQLNNSTQHVAVDVTKQLVLASQADGVAVYDAAVLPDFRLLSFIPIWSAPTHLDFSRTGQALVSLGVGGVAVVDLTDPVQPQIVASIPLAGPVSHVIAHPVSSNILYLALEDGRLVTLMYQPGNPQNIVVTSDIPLAGRPTRLAVDSSGHTLIVATGRAGLKAFSIRFTPNYPELLAELPTQHLDQLGMTQIHYLGNRRWVTLDGQTVRLLRLTGDVFTEEDQFGTSSQTLVVAPDNAILMGGENHLEALVVSGRELYQTMYYKAPTIFTDMRALLGQVVVASDVGLVVLDVTNPFFPREQRFIPTPFPPERFLLHGDDILITNPNEGLAHLRFSLLMASYEEIEPVLVGNYHPLTQIREIMPLSNGQFGFLGNYTWIPTLQKRGAITGIAYEGGVILINQDHSLTRLDGMSEVIAENSDLYAAALATDGKEVWVTTSDGRLAALDPMSLLPLNDERPLNIQPTTMFYHTGQLWIGTRSGEIWNVTTSLHYADLGGAIQSIAALDEKTLLVSAGAGGLWWLSGEKLHTPYPAYSVDVMDEWIAVAAGRCGLQIFDRTGTLWARWENTFVTDVEFIEIDQILAIANGVPTLYKFNPTQSTDLPPVAYHPSPEHLSITAAQVLRWEMEAETCLPLQHEVWLNGKLAGITQARMWQLSEPLIRDLSWKIITVDPFGNKRESAEWLIYAPITGWLSKPFTIQGTVVVDSTQTRTSLPWWAFGMVLAGLAGIALVRLLGHYLSLM